MLAPGRGWVTPDELIFLEEHDVALEEGVDGGQGADSEGDDEHAGGATPKVVKDSEGMIHSSLVKPAKSVVKTVDTHAPSLKFTMCFKRIP